MMGGSRLSVDVMALEAGRAGSVNLYLTPW